MGTFFNTIPSQTVGQSTLPRNIFTTANTTVFKDVPGMFIISGSLTRDPGQLATSGNSSSLLRAGLLVGKNTTTGLYRNSVYGTLQAAITTASTTAVVSYGAASELARQETLAGASSQTFLFLGPPTAAGTVATVSATASTIVLGTTTGTLTITAPSAALAAGTILGPTDGALTPITVLCDNPFGIDVNDINGNNLNQQLQRMLIGADLLTAQIINLSGTDDFGITIDTSVTTWLMGRLQLNGNQFTFNTNR